MTNEQQTEAPELKPCPFCGGEVTTGYFAEEFVVGCPTCKFEVSTYDDGPDDPSLKGVAHWNTRTDLANAAVGAAVRACAEAILHDHTKPDDNRLWGDERPYICEESAYRTILALEPDAQQALDKLLAEKDAEIERTIAVAKINVEAAEKVMEKNARMREHCILQAFHLPFVFQ